MSILETDEGYIEILMSKKEAKQLYSALLGLSAGSDFLPLYDLMEDHSYLYD